MFNHSAVPLRVRFPRLKVSLRFTREGLIFILLSLAIGAAAVNTGNNVLYLIFSLMLGLIVVSGMISRRMLSNLEAAVDFPDRIFAGAQTVSYVSLKNKKKAVPSFGIRITFGMGMFPEVSRYFFYVRPGTAVNGFATSIFAKRGVYKLSEVQLQTRFPFSFFLKIVRQPLEKTIRVYPQVFRLPDDMISQFTDGMLSESPYRGDSAQLLHLRDYSPLDSRKRIHWKASAKNEKLLVKELQKEHGRDLYVYFDCYPDGKSKQKLQESGLSLLASLAFIIKEKGLRAKFCFPDAAFSLHNGETAIYRLLDYLSEIRTERPSSVQYEVPSGADSVILHIRSHEVPPILLPNWPQIRVRWIEDFAALLKQSSRSPFGGSEPMKKIS